MITTTTVLVLITIILLLIRKTIPSSRAQTTDLSLSNLKISNIRKTFNMLSFLHRPSKIKIHKNLTSSFPRRSLIEDSLILLRETLMIIEVKQQLKNLLIKTPL